MPTCTSSGTFVRLSRGIIYVHWVASLAATATAATDSFNCQLPDPSSQGNEITCSDDLNFVTSKGVNCSAHKGVKCEMLPFFGFSKEEVDMIISHCPCSCQAASESCRPPTPMPSPMPTLASVAAADPDETMEVEQRSEPTLAEIEENDGDDIDQSFWLSTWGIVSMSVCAAVVCLICAYAVKKIRQPATHTGRKSISTQQNDLEEDSDEWNNYCSDDTTKSPTADEDIEKGKGFIEEQSAFEASTAKVDNRAAGDGDMGQDTTKLKNSQSKQIKPIPQKKKVFLIGGLPESVVERDACKDCSRKKKCRKHREKKKKAKKELCDSTSKRSWPSWFIPSH